MKKDKYGLLLLITVGLVSVPSISQAQTNDSTKVSQIEEIVMVGYGRQKKTEISGSITSVDDKQLKGMVTSNFADAMAGKVTGVQVTQGSGSPGTSPTIRVRGIGTLTAGSNPLIVVDGFPMSEGTSINAIDPSSIAKIDILKDAASASIYGSRGANGVILIETKRGAKGRLNVNLDTYYGMQFRSDNVKYVNAYEMAQFLKEGRDNNYLSKGTNRSANDDTATRKSKGASLRELIPDYLIPYLNGEPGLTDTDWLNEVLKPAPISQTSLSISGGADKTRYSVTGTYFNQQGLMIGTDYEKMSANLNLETDISSKFKFGISLTPVHETGSKVHENGRTYNPLQMASISYPFFAPRDSAGNLIISEQIRVNTATDGALVENPVALMEMTKRRYTNFRTFGNAFAEYSFFKDLKYKLSLGGDYATYEYNFFDPSTVGAYRAAAPDPTVASRQTYDRKNYLVENLLTYNKRINGHNFNIIAGQSYQNETSTGSIIDATNFADNSITNIAGGSSQVVTPTQYEWALISYFTRLNYNFRNRYSLMGSYRRDGSSRFGANSKWGDFYAFSASWSVSNEGFWPKNDYFDDFKLRYSHGTNGNNQIPNFGALALLGRNDYIFGGSTPTLYPGYRSRTAPNPDISWEKSKSNNFGIDFSLFKRLLTFSADYYILNRDGLLLNVPVPEQSGFTSSLQNIGRVRNKGFEAQLALKPLTSTSGNFSYNGSLNFSTNKNEVLALANGQDRIVTGANNFAITRVGGEIGEMWGYNILGVYKSQAEIDSTPHIKGTLVGDYIMEDLNGDGKIDENDKKKFGTGVPKYILGFNNSFRIGQFDFSFTLYSELDRTVYNGDAVNTLDSGEGFGMASKDYFDNRFHPTLNPNGKYAMPNMNYSNNRKESRTSSIFFKDADYLRLRSVKLGYNLPVSLTDGLNIRSMQIYLLGNNVFTITNYKGQNIDANTDNVLTQGYDSGYYPIARSVSMGLNINF